MRSCSCRGCMLHGTTQGRWNLWSGSVYAPGDDTGLRRGRGGEAEDRGRDVLAPCCAGFSPRALLSPLLPTSSLLLLRVLRVLRPAPPPLLQLPTHEQPDLTTPSTPFYALLCPPLNQVRFQHLRPRRTITNALPPASPAAHELDVQNPEVTVFLIGAYAKYNWPYVWVSVGAGRGAGAGQGRAARIAAARVSLRRGACQARVDNSVADCGAKGKADAGVRRRGVSAVRSFDWDIDQVLLQQDCPGGSAQASTRGSYDRGRWAQAGARRRTGGRVRDMGWPRLRPVFACHSSVPFVDYLALPARCSYACTAYWLR